MGVGIFDCEAQLDGSHGVAYDLKRLPQKSYALLCFTMLSYAMLRLAEGREASWCI